MTREEIVNSMSLQDAIQVLKDTNCYGTMDIAKSVILKALEQEPIIDKIRAEISALKSHHINDCYDDGFQGFRIKVLHILDKYNAESEGKE